MMKFVGKFTSLGASCQHAQSANPIAKHLVGDFSYPVSADGLDSIRDSIVVVHNVVKEIATTVASHRPANSLPASLVPAQQILLGRIEVGGAYLTGLHSLKFANNYFK